MKFVSDGPMAGRRPGISWQAVITILFVTVCAGAQAPKAVPVSPLPAQAVEWLSAHNAVRGKVNLPPLQWSDQLALAAQKWADTLLATHQFQHSDSPYGENLFDITGTAARPSLVVKHWALEAINYNYESNTCRGLCGHYTQIVWRESERVGCAVARGGGREVWVCSYDPAGNWLGRRPY